MYKVNLDDGTSYECDTIEPRLEKFLALCITKKWLEAEVTGLWFWKKTEQAHRSKDIPFIFIQKSNVKDIKVIP